MLPVAEVRPEEKAVGALEHTEGILDAIREQGVAVLHNCIDPSVCELLQAPLYADAQRMLEGSFWPPQPERGALGNGHVNLGAPRCAPWVHSDVVGNPIVEQVVAAAIGTGAVLGFYNGLCNLSGSRPQPLHLGSAWAWQTEAEAEAAGQEWPPSATTLAVYIAVDDIDASNGAEEVWPGSHRDTAAATLSAGEALTGGGVEDRRRLSPPTRLVIPKGSVAFVDARLWRRVSLQCSAPLGRHPLPRLPACLSAELHRNGAGRVEFRCPATANGGPDVRRTGLG